MNIGTFNVSGWKFNKMGENQTNNFEGEGKFVLLIGNQNYKDGGESGFKFLGIANGLRWVLK